MKKITILVISLAMALGISAQDDKNWSLIPRIGLNISNLGDMDIEYSTNGTMKPHAYSNVMAGAEFDYSLNQALSVGVGAFYSRQGCHYKGYSTPPYPIGDDVMRSSIVESSNVVLQYLNIPVTGTLHLSENLAFKTGIQCGVLLSGSWDQDETIIDTKNGEIINNQSVPSNTDMNELCSKTVWSIPLGFQVEYEKILVDVSYAIPLTGFCKSVMTDDGSEIKFSKGCNKVLTFSVGYRF